MGFRVSERTATVVGQDDYEGFIATVRISPIPMAFAFEMQARMQSRDADTVQNAFREFGERVLIEWNLEGEAGPIPATGEGILQADQGVVGAMIKGWAEATKEPPLVNAGPPSNGHIPALAGLGEH